MILECLAGEPNGFGDGFFGNPLSPFQNNTLPSHSGTDLFQDICDQDAGSPERGLTVAHCWVSNDVPADHARLGLGSDWVPPLDYSDAYADFRGDCLWN